MLVTCLKQLEERRTLGYMDRVYFTVGKETIEYEVDGMFLHNLESSAKNDKVFRLLEIDKYELSEKTYGYKVKREDPDIFWPESLNDDYPALTRLVKELYLIIEEEVIPVKNRWELLDL